MKTTVYYCLTILALLSFASCEKEEFNLQTTENYTSNLSKSESTKKPNWITLCHKSGNSYNLLQVNAKSLDKHLAHGDIILEDLDGDGYYPDNECGFIPMGDLDDNDPFINPGMNSICGDGPCGKVRDF